MPRRGFFENFGYSNVWTPGVLATGSSYVASSSRWYQWADASVLLYWVNSISGAVTHKLVHEYSLDGVSYSSVKESDVFTPPGAGFYVARIHKDLLPREVSGDLRISTVPVGALLRWKLVLAAGTNVTQSGVEIWERMIETPSKGQAFSADPSGRGQGHHYNEFGSARLENDSSGNPRVVFDLSP
jgi:hypothetical protein